MNINTDVLLKRLCHSSTIDGFLSRNQDELAAPDFVGAITRLCIDRQVPPEKVINKANIERSFGHQIFRGRRRPSRDVIIQLAFGFESSVDETQTLLKLAGASALYPRVKRDAVILFCIHKGYGLIDTQIMLSDLSLPLLGCNPK